MNNKKDLKKVILKMYRVITDVTIDGFDGNKKYNVELDLNYLSELQNIVSKKLNSRYGLNGWIDGMIRNFVEIDRLEKEGYRRGIKENGRLRTLKPSWCKRAARDCEESFIVTFFYLAGCLNHGI